MFDCRRTKYISGKAYNLLNLPGEIIFENGNRIKYYYDAAGTKWRKVVNGSDTSRTDYVGAMILENDTLKQIQTAEGRIVADTAGQAYHYQYYLKDHLGNVRLTFGAEPDTVIYTATMESELASEEEAQFANIADYRQISTQFNHTTGGVATPNESVMLNSTLTVNGEPRTTAAMKSLKVQAGDTVNMEVWAKHLGTDQSSEITANTFIFAALTSGFGLMSTGETALAHEGFKHVFETILLHDQSPGDVPTAYLNYIFFNDDYDTAEAKRPVGYQQISSAAENNFEKLVLDFVAPESGYLYIYVSNESNLDVNVYFDDLKITHKSSLSIVQADDYYPFGMSFNSFMDTTETKQNYLYNGKELQTNLDLDWYDYGARMYDAAIGRWHVVDPLAEDFPSWTPYHYVHNNPLNMIDPTGMSADWVEGADGEIKWDDKATSQETTKKGETYLGKNVIVEEGASADENGNVEEGVNEATISLYTPENKEEPTSTMQGNTVSADGDKYATIAAGTMEGEKTTYKKNSAILINGGGKVPTTKNNPNPESNYYGQKYADQIFIHAGNKNYKRLTTSDGKAITKGCQTGCSGDRATYLKFMEKVPDNTKIKIVLKRNK